MKLLACFFSILILSVACKPKNEVKIVDNSSEVVDSLRNPQHQAYLMDLNTKTTAELILFDSVKASDNLFTFRLMDSLNSSNITTRVYYFKVVTKMMQHSDGILSEGLGRLAWNYAQEHTLEFIHNFVKLNEEERNRWATEIAGELGIANEGQEKAAIGDYIKKLKRNCQKCTTANKKMLDEFGAAMIKQVESWQNN